MPSNNDELLKSSSSGCLIATLPITYEPQTISLHSMCMKGDHTTLEDLIVKEGCDVNELCDGSTPLTLAAYNGFSRCVKVLLQHNAKPNLRNEHGDQPLHLAAKRSHKKCAVYLLAHGADVNSISSAGLTPLHIAAKYGHDKLLRLLLENKAKIDRYTETENPQHALHLAASRGHLLCIKTLLEFNKFTEPRDNYGRTPMFLAAFKGRRDAVLALSLAGADANAADKTGKIPLQVAVDSGFDDVCHTLCEHGGDVSLRYFCSRALDDTSECSVDRYGQIKPDEGSDIIGDITKIGEQARYLQNELSHVKQWERMIKHWHKYTHHMMDKVRKRIARGIPDTLRGQVWKLLCNMKAQVDSTQYHELRIRESTWVHQIDVDVSRAFRNHVLYRKRYGRGQCALFSLLKAYSNFDPVLGYCQGMGDMAALLLKYMKEKETFSVFDILMKDTKWGMRGCFMPGFPKLQRTFFVHDKLLELVHPKLHGHLKKEGADAALYATRWYMTVFLDAFRYEVTLRIWDLFFMDGSDALYSVAIAILTMFQDELLNMRFDKIMVFMHTMGQRNLDVDEFIAYVMEHRISTRSIRKFEQMYTQEGTAIQGGTATM